MTLPKPKSNGHSHNQDGSHKGPHGGHVIDLGRNHQHHAELVENHESESLTIYILGEDLKETPIDQERILLTLTVDDETSSFELRAANPADGKTSMFESDDEDLFKALHHEHLVGKLRVTIDGKQLTGDLNLQAHGHSHTSHLHNGDDA